MKVQPLPTLLFCLVTTLASAQPSAFTYQGRLTENNQPASGSYDLRIILYNADVGGSQAGTIVTILR